MNLTTEADLAKEWGIPVEKFAELRRQNHWPHVRLTRFDVRYTDEQVAAIVEIQTRRTRVAESAGRSALPGQTSRSASRKKSA